MHALSLHAVCASVSVLLRQLGSRSQSREGEEQLGEVLEEEEAAGREGRKASKQDGGQEGGGTESGGKGDREREQQQDHMVEDLELLT